MKTNKPIFLMALLIIIPFNLAIEPTLTSNSILLSPYYSDGFNSGVVKQYNLSVNPPDGITTIESAILKFHAYILPTVTYTLKVNNLSCNTPTYTVTTTQASAGMSDVSFDCKNIITKAGNYNVTLTANKNTGAITSTLELTYTNNPFGILTLHGTEYQVGDPIKVWLQLLNSNQNIIANASCFTDLYYPNGQTLYSKAQMQYTTNGIYEINFIAPNVLGVYPAIASCFYQTSTATFLASSGAILNGTLQSNDYTVTQTSDVTRWQVNEALNSLNQRVAVQFNFSNITQPNLFNDLVLHWEGQWNSQVGDDLTFQIFNFSNNQWISLPNKVIAPTGGGDNIVTNTLVFETSSNLTAMGILQNKVLRARIIDTADLDVVSSRIQTDYISVILHSLSNETWQELKGSSEVHIRSPEGLNYQVVNDCGTKYNQICGYFQPDPTPEQYFSPEGVIVENLTVKNIADIDESTIFIHQEPQNIDCTAIYSITQINQNGSTQDITEEVGYSLGSQSNCILQIPLQLIKNVSETKYTIISDNYLKWEVIWNKDRINGMNKTLTTYCQQLGNQYSFTYNVPLNGSVQGTEELAYCNRILDDLYYFYSYYDESTGIDNTQEYLSSYYETQFYTIPIYQHFFKIGIEINKQNLDSNNYLLSYINQTLNALNDTLLLEKMSLMNQTMSSKIDESNSMMMNHMNQMQLNMTISMNDLVQVMTAPINFPKMTIHGTEYGFGQTSKAWLQLLDPTGQTALNNAICYMDIFNPDMTNLLDETQMLKLNTDGIFYYDIVLPFIEGVYPVTARCFYTAISTTHFFNNVTVLNGTLGSGAITDTQIVDGNFLRITEATYSGVRRVIAEFNMTNNQVCQNVSEALLQSVSLTSTIRFASTTGDDITFQIFNYTSGQFINLPNKFTASGSFLSTTNTLFTNNVSKLNITGQDYRGLRIRLTDTNITDGVNNNLDIDSLVFECNQLGNSSFQELKGSSEMHLSKDINSTLADQFEIWRQQSSLQYLNLTGQLNNLSNQLNLTTQMIANNTATIIAIVNQNQNLTTLQINQLNFTITQQYIDTITKLYEINATTQLIIPNLTSLINFQTNNLINLINSSFNITNNQIAELNQTISSQYLFISQNLTAINVKLDFIQQLILSLNNSVNQNINLSNQILNVTQENQGWLIALWNYITGYLTNLTQQVNQTTIENQALLNIILNQTNTTGIPTTITYTTDNCISGSNWIVSTTVRNQFGSIMTNETANCNIFTTIDNLTNPMSYTPTEFFYTTTCPSQQSWNWSITCV